MFLLKSLSSSPLVPESNDLQLPKSMLSTSPESEPEGLAVIVSKSQIIVGETVVCPVPARRVRSTASRAKYKRGSRNDFFIVPLGSALRPGATRTSASAWPPGKDPSQSEAILIADQHMPYRLLTEVMYTLGQTEFAKFHMMVLQGGPRSRRA